MATNHFNKLTEAEQERLVLLMEECGEVVQAVSTILRHGYESTNPKIPNSETNRQALEREVGDALSAAYRLVNAGDLSGWASEQRRMTKTEPYLHHQDE